MSGAKKVAQKVQLQFERRGQKKNIELAPTDSLARVLRTMRNEGFPPTPDISIPVGHPDSCQIQLLNQDGSVWASQYTFQLIDLDTNAAKAKAALSASQGAAASMEEEPAGKLRERSESTLITRTGNLERRSQVFGDGTDNGPRVSSIHEPMPSFDSTVRIVDEAALQGTLSDNFDQFLDLNNDIDISKFHLSDMEMEMRADSSGAIGEDAKQQPGSRDGSTASIRRSSGRDSSGIEVYQFTKAELQRIGGLKKIMDENPNAFPCHKVKRTTKPTQYNVIAFNASGTGPQCVMEAIPLPDSGTPLYQCGYCRAVKSSSSAGADGRVRIRCECGGKHKDGKARMHANWNLVKSSLQQGPPALQGVPENQRMGSKSSKMQANRHTMGFGPVKDEQERISTGSDGHGRVSDDVLYNLNQSAGQAPAAPLNLNIK